jgi:hypothetical protein
MPLFTTLRSRALRTTFVVLAALLVLSDAGSAQTPTSARAQVNSIDPLDMLLTADDAGADAVQVKESQGEDGPAHWARRRWERDGADGSSGTTQRNNRGSTKDAGSAKERDSHYTVSGPLVLDNTVYVANDLAAAKQVYQNEVSKQSTFPEATDQVSGNFPFPMTPLGDESAALSACSDCMSKDEIYVHRRTVVRRGPVVTVVYTYGVDKVITEDLATWFAGQALSHIPDDIPVASGPPSIDGSSAPDADPGQARPTGQPHQPEGQSQDQGQGQTITARPQDLAVKLAEAGKSAEKKDEKDGSDDTSSWYRVRFERPHTFAMYRSGPVTVFSQVFVAKSRAAADQVFQGQAGQNEKFPEATEKVGGAFELKGLDDLGAESRGLSACNTSCNSDKEIYLHKRIVSRVENVVSVVYVWGLANEEGVTDASARYFANLVIQRIRG